MVVNEKQICINSCITRFDRISRRSLRRKDYATAMKAGKIVLDYQMNQKPEMSEHETIWDKDKLLSLLDYLEEQLEQP